jgi:hypothetical protein
MYMNKLSIFQWYAHVPTWIPKHKEQLDFVCDLPSLEVQPTPPIHMEATHKILCAMPANPFTLFPNLSVALYMAVYFSGMDMKSEEHMTLVAMTMQDPWFSPEEMMGFNSMLT